MSYLLGPPVLRDAYMPTSSSAVGKGRFAHPELATLEDTRINEKAKKEAERKEMEQPKEWVGLDGLERCPGRIRMRR